MSEKSGGRTLIIGMQILLALVANSKSLDTPATAGSLGMTT
jgi:hypothetical protein